MNTTKNDKIQTIRKKKVGRPSKRPPVEQLDALYQVLPAKEIAKMYNVPVNTVYGWVADVRRQAKQEEILTITN